ncbi:MAG: DUF2794 domain-containing protein [Hyphomonadaceae bacterium]
MLTGSAGSTDEAKIFFLRAELDLVLSLYGKLVAQGEWRDYAIDSLRDRVVFSVFRRTSESPLYQIEKRPALARRQGAFAVIAQGGLVMRRGHDLAQVLKVFDRQVVRLAPVD